MLSVTPTKLSDYLVCPQKYKFRHINKTETAATSPALSFGQAMHSALQVIHRSDEDLRDLTGVSRILNRYWEADAYSDEEESEAYFSKGCRSLHAYCKNFDFRENKTLGTEVYLSYILKVENLKIRLGCKADRISVCADGTLEIVDYKTNGSGKVPTPEYLRNDLPAFLYYVLARLSYPQYKQIRVTFLNIMTLAKVSVEYDGAQVASNKQALLKCLRSLAGEDLPPKPSEACSWCSFQDECPARNKIVDFASIF